MTREQLDEMEDYDQEPFTGFNHYTLLGENSENVRYAGTCKRKAVRTLDPTIDCVSLVIRHHLSREEARAYYFGLDDCRCGYPHGAVLQERRRHLHADHSADKTELARTSDHLLRRRCAGR